MSTGPVFNVRLTVDELRALLAAVVFTQEEMGELPAFTLERYVHLLDDGVGEPLSLNGELNG